MSYIKLSKKQINAEALGPDKNQLKKIEGYLVGVELNCGQRKNSSIYELKQIDGKTRKVWGCFEIDSALLDGEGKHLALPDSLKGVMCRMTYTGQDKFGRGKKKQTIKHIDVEVDPNKCLQLAKVGKVFVLEPGKKLAKKSATKSLQAGT